MSSKTKRKPFRVLCLEGGGMRGIYSAQYLSSLCEFHMAGRMKNTFGDLFDLIVGTSTGAIIASGLAHNISLDEIVHLYKENGVKIFPLKVRKNKFRLLLDDILFRKNALQTGDINLRRLLEETLGETTFGDLSAQGKRLCIPVTDLSKHHPTVLKTNHLNLTADQHKNISLVDACMASSAAPIYRSIAGIQLTKNETKTPFVDGGIWANNPTLVGLVEALAFADSDEIEVYNLNACPAPTGTVISPKEYHKNIAGWHFGADIANLSIDVQQKSHMFIAQLLADHIDRKCTLISFPSPQVSPELMNFLELDETSTTGLDALINQAIYDARNLFSIGWFENTKSKACLKNLFKSS